MLYHTYALSTHLYFHVWLTDWITLWLIEWLNNWAAICYNSANLGPTPGNPLQCLIAHTPCDCVCVSGFICRISVHLWRRSNGNSVCGCANALRNRCLAPFVQASRAYTRTIICVCLLFSFFFLVVLFLGSYNFYYLICQCKDRDRKRDGATEKDFQTCMWLFYVVVRSSASHELGQ